MLKFVMKIKEMCLAMTCILFGKMYHSVFVYRSFLKPGSKLMHFKSRNVFVPTDYISE